MSDPRENQNPFDLTGRVAVVTGGARGIGRAIALALARSGADVAVCDLAGAPLDQVATEIDAFGRRSLAVVADVADAAAVTDFFSRLDDALGRIDILVNNVGIGARHRPEALPIAEWDKVLATGATATLRCAQEAGKRMIAQGSGGSIINISSIAGAAALGRGNLAHSANKGAVNALTRELAVEWAMHGIRVNAILPCQVLTEGFQGWLDSPSFDPGLMEQFLNGIPMNRLATPDDIAGPAVFLASDAAAMVTGVLLPVDGGNLALNAGGSHTWTTA